MGSTVPLLTISGRFFRAILTDRIDVVLAPPGPHSAGRYHRLGQPALYVTHDPDWARIAVSGYMREDGLPRMIVPVDIDAARVLDQRDAVACAALGIDRDQSNVNWRVELAAGREPASWRNADAAREIGADGIIDRSRHIPGGWHVTLFRWNQPGAPSVAVAGTPFAAILSDSDRHWG
ncbi:MAG: RES family NAD+ phosphorylase [Sphingomonas sp.]|nr:RES family NAD+ phosphorylase [Sphingomonas sp.]